MKRPQGPLMLEMEKGGRREEHGKTDPIYHSCAIFPETQHLATNRGHSEHFRVAPCGRQGILPAMLVQSPSGQCPTWERVLHSHAGADGGSSWGCCTSGMFLSLIRAVWGLRGFRSPCTFQLSLQISHLRSLGGLHPRQCRR